VAFDEGLAQRVREQLDGVAPAREMQMFGGLAFLVAGNMCVGVIGEELIARVGPAAADGALARPGARPFDFTGRPMKGWVVVGTDGTDDDGSLAGWVADALAFVGTLAPK
jgi:TfoX/Sxy family transcriptional regulator of competence genes